MKNVEYMRGMTLVEALVWISVFTMAMIAIVSTLISFYRTNTYTLEQAEAVTSAQRALDQTVRAIREGAYSSQGAFPIISARKLHQSFHGMCETPPKGYQRSAIMTRSDLK